MELNPKHGVWALATGVAVACVGVTTVASAQDVVGKASVEEIVVYTRKKEESLQSVPLSVTAFTSEDIQKLGIEDVRDVSRYTPGIIFDEGFGQGDQRLVIRGLSPSRGRPNSAVLIDGIDLTTQAITSAGGSLLFDQRLLDVQNIEVVKGPQSALYGRSAFAGALQYITKDPTEELEGTVGLDVGNFDRYLLRGGVSGAVTDTFGLRVNGLYWNEGGFYDDALTGGELGGGEGYGFSASAKWEATEDLTIKSRVSYADDEFDPQATIFFRANRDLPAPQSAIDGGVADPGDTSGIFGGQAGDIGNAQPRLSANPRTGQAYPGGERDVLNVTFIADLRKDYGTFSSLTGYLDGTSSQYIDGDQDVVLNPAGNLDIARGGAEFRATTDTELFSQEFRFASDFDGPLQVTAGALYWVEKAEQIDTGVTILTPFTLSPPGYNNLGVASTVPNPVLTARDTDHWSVYGLLEWEINDSWRASFEGRYASERLEVTGSSCGVLPPLDFTCAFIAPSLSSEFPFGSGLFAQPAVIELSDAVRDDYFAPKATLEWQSTENALIYASVAQGIKPAGISAVGAGSFLDADGDLRLDEAKFDKEKLLSYELGAKTDWFDSSLRLNGAVFFQQYTDKQIAIQRLVGGFPSGFIENAGEAEVFGIELDAVWVPTDNWTLALSYAYLDGEYTDFKYQTNSLNNIVRAGNCVPDLTGTLCTVDLSGRSLEDIPEHALNGSISYRHQLADTGMDWFAEGNVLYQDERFADEFNDRGVDSFSIVDLRAGLQADSWTVTLYVNNVLDNDTFQNWTGGGGGLVETAEQLSFFPASGLGYAPDPRHYGVRANFTF